MVKQQFFFFNRPLLFYLGKSTDLLFPLVCKDPLDAQKEALLKHVNRCIELKNKQPGI